MKSCNLSNFIANQSAPGIEHQPKGSVTSQFTFNHLSPDWDRSGTTAGGGGGGARQRKKQSDDFLRALDTNSTIPLTLHRN